MTMTIGELIIICITVCIVVEIIADIFKKR